MCGGNGQDSGGLEIHHIWGRVSWSAFNSSCLCKECHGHVGHSREERTNLLRITVSFLQGKHKWEDEDSRFFSIIKNDLTNFTL